MMKWSSDWNTADADAMNMVKNMMIAAAITTIIVVNAVKAITTAIVAAKKKTKSSELKRGCLIASPIFISERILS